MYHDRNYNGCIDQLLQLRHLNADATEREEAFYYLAMATLHSGDDEALDLLKEYLDTYPQSPRHMDVLMSTADYFFTRNNYPDALKIYRQVTPDALDADRSEDLAYRLAYSCMMLGEDQNAMLEFDKLSGSSRYDNAALFYKGYLAYNRHDFKTAKEHFSKVNTAVEPGINADCYLCQIYFIEHDYSMALNTAQKILGRECSGQFAPEINRIAGESLYNLGDPIAAVPYLRQYIDTADKPMPSAFYMLGVCMYSDADYAGAIPLFQKAVGVSDAMGQSAYLYLGQCYVKCGNTDGALIAFENAYRQNYDENVAETAFYNYIVARADGGRVPFGNSVAMLEEFLKKYPRSVHADAVRDNLISGYLSGDDYENALRVLENVNRPDNGTETTKQKVLFILGTREYQSGNIDTSFQYFNRALAISPGNPTIALQCRLWHGLCLYDMERYEDAVNDIEHFIKLATDTDPNRTIAYYNLGYSLFALEQYSGAFNNFRQTADNANASQQMKADAYNRMADCMYYNRNYSEAADYYKKALETYPQAGDYAIYRLAAISGLSGDSKAKADGFRRLMTSYPSSPLIPAALLDLAQTHAADGNTAGAITAYSDLIERYPSTSQGRKGMLQMALLQYDRGYNDDGIKTYRRIIATYPSSEEASVAVDDLKRIYAENGKLTELADFLNSVPDAPKINISEIDAATFRAAETDYLDNHSTSRLNRYVSEYPDGAYMARALYYLAENAYENGDADNTLKYTRRLIESHPDSEMAEDALLIEAETERSEGMGERALESYSRLEARASTPQNIRLARAGIMRTAIELGHYGQALEAADRLLASNMSGTDPAEDEVRFCKALSLSHIGELQQARDIWSGLALSTHTLIGAKSSVYLSESLLESDEPDQAIAVANALIESGSPHNYWLARAYIVLSDALRTQGNEFDADEYLKLLKANYPGDEPDIMMMIQSRLNE